MQNFQGYILVKDKDGQMKYFKDGKFFSLDEVKKIVEETAPTQTAKKKVELKPIITFQDKKIVEAPKSAPVEQLIPVKVSVSSEQKTANSEQSSSEQLTASKEQLIEDEELESPVPSVTPVTPVTPVSPVTPARPESEPPVAPVTPKEIKLADVPKPPAKNFDFESIEPDEEIKQRRFRDQELVQQRAQEVIDRLKIQFTDDHIRSRFMNVLLTYFRGIRGPAEVEYILALSREGGGLGLPKEKAEMIMSVLKHHSDATNKERRVITVQPKEKIMPPPPSVRPEPESPIGRQDTSGSVVTPVSQAVAQAERRQVPPVTPVPPVAPVTPVAPVPQMVKPAVVRPVAPQVAPKSPVMGDVKITNRLVGPIEELTYMTVDDFRRLGKNIEEIISSLLEKIQLLADESLARKIQGIKAWKQSPVFMLYLKMSMDGIMQGKTIEQVIIDKQKEHADCLTLSEYEAIGRLNKQLVY